MKEQRQKIDQLTSKLDQFIELMMNNNNGVPPQSVPQGVVDPQEEDLQAGALTSRPPHHEHQHEETSAHARQWARPSGPADTTLQQSMLKGYHDILKDMV